MKSYANAEERGVMLMIATMETWIANILEDTPKCLDKPAIKRRAIQMLKHLSALTAAAVSDLDEDACDALHRHVYTQSVQIVPKDKLKYVDTHVVVEAEDFEYLMSRIDDCHTCLKSPAEVKGCKIRKALLRCGAIPTGDRSECPFMP